MKFVVLCFSAVLLVGCHVRQPKTSDAAMQRIRAAEPGMTDECLNKIRWEGIEAITSRPEEDCYKFEKPRRWKGLWRNEFEGSRFCPEPATQCSDNTRGEWIWFEWSPSAGAPPYEQSAGALYSVDFVGRMTAYPGGYGHLGMSREEIVVDRMISLKQLESPPPPMSEAQKKAYDKWCETNPQCLTPEEAQTGKK